MAATRDTLRLLRRIRIRIEENVDAATDDLVRAWARTWDVLVVEWEAAADELQDIRDDGHWPTRAQIRRAERTQKALHLTRQALDDLAENAGITVIGRVPDVVDVAGDHVDVIASQYPAKAGTRAEVAATLERVDREQLDAIVERTTDQITSLMRPLSLEAMHQLNAHLVKGVALGRNPRDVARRLIRRLEGGFNGGLTRALVVARTEMLDAHRAAAAAHHKANADVLRGWQWVAQLDRRTCPSCWAQHGSEHRLSDPGPLDHQQGRCARLPLTKSWADLGFDDIDEPASLVTDARAAFDALSPADRLAVMGRERLRRLEAGELNWGDLSQRRTTRGWRDSYGVAPLNARA